MRSLQATVKLMLSVTTEIGQMRGHPEYRDWAENLRSLGRLDQLAPLQKALCALADDALTTLNPLNEFLNEQAAAIPAKVYWQATETVEKTLPDSPHAAFVLAMLSLLGWAHFLGDRLYEQINGMPDFGWTRIPYSCALAAFELDDIDGARQLVEHSYDTLMAGKYQWDPRLLDALATYRQLAGKIQRRYEMAIANLADDLRESCRPGAANFRADTGAILWSLGMVPESQAFRSTADPGLLPSRWLFRRLVKQSMECIPHDPLVQYLWLELKDRPPFNIREHKSLFAIINIRYGQLMLDEAYPVPPSQAYARSLIGLFQGSLNIEQAREYMSCYELIQAMFPQMDWTVYLRMNGLAYHLGRMFGWLHPDLTRARELEQWASLTDRARSLRENNNKHPDWPEIYCRPNLPLFNLIEAVCGPPKEQNPPQKGELEKLLAAIETFRSSALSYWLKVVPPLPSDEEQSLLHSHLEKEKELLSHLRGAYFLTLLPILPRHYTRYGTTVEEIQDPRRAEKFSPQTGREELAVVQKELEACYHEQEKLAPCYAQKRLVPVATLASLLQAINDHSSD